MRNIVILCVLLVMVAGCNVGLHHGLTEEDANQILVLLQQHGIHAKKEKEEGRQRKQTWKITVPKGQCERAWKLLQEHGLPRTKNKGFDEVFRKTGIIPTATEEKAMFLHALCGELARTLKTIHGVIDARVHVAIPDDEHIRTEEEPVPQPTASVFLKYKLDDNVVQNVNKSHEYNKQLLQIMELLDKLIVVHEELKQVVTSSAGTDTVNVINKLIDGQETMIMNIKRLNEELSKEGIPEYAALHTSPSKLEIKRLIASSVEGLTPDNVVVVQEFVPVEDNPDVIKVSSTRLKIITLCIILVIILLSGVLILGVIKMNNMRRQLVRLQGSDK
jgi:type III secretion system YscJ/HrcJ family lipoprotein